MNPVAPTRVIGGRYVVLAELGRGGMGIVWRAEDRVMGRQVAVKELHLPSGLMPGERRLFRERLLREARTAGRLNSPGIVTVYDVVTDGDVDHIVMELIEARTLDQVVARSGPLDERTVESVAQQLVAALRTAHDNGVVHRDVKPSNVMLGADGHVTLTDFGIAYATDDPRLTATGSIIGSPGYLAPERLSGGEATPATDMWALGATLCLAATGSAPFARDSTAATMAAVLHADVPQVRTRGPLGAVIGGLLQRSPQARLSGAQAGALLAAPPEAAPLAVVGGPSRRGSDPNRWAGVAALLVFGLLIGGVGGWFAGRGSAGHQAVPVFSYGEGGDVPVFASSSTGCILGRVAAGRAVPSSARVSCDQPHDAEVFAVLAPFETNRVLPYPGTDQLGAYGRSACTVVFDSGVVTGADKDRLQVAVLVPSAAEFGRDAGSGTSHSFGDRDVYCALQSRDGAQITGTRVAEPG